jgi:dTDP-4-amino-4,6-dideoxygalactose transaminase
MIQCADPLQQYLRKKNEIKEAIYNVLENGNYILGPETKKFENNFANFCGVKYAIGVANGTDALFLALKALDIKCGDEVITVSHTALATISAILASGAIPVLVDIDMFYNIDPFKLKNAITKKTKAIIVVHLYGQMADLDTIKSVTSEFKIPIIEDCAQATGAEYKGKSAGSIGDIGCFSFYPTKNLGAIGDGGMVVTSNTNIYNRIIRLRQYGWDSQRNTIEPGINSRLDEIQAAILNVKLNYLKEDNEKRRIIASFYSTGLKNIEYIELPKEREFSKHVYHLYVIKIKNRTHFKNKLEEKKIFAGINYLNPPHQQCGYKNQLNISNDGLNYTESILDEILSLPMYPELTINQASEVISVLKNL